MDKNKLNRTTKRYSSWRWFLFPVIFLRYKRARKVLFRGVWFPLLLIILLDIVTHIYISSLYIPMRREFIPYLIKQALIAIFIFPIPEPGIEIFFWDEKGLIILRATFWYLSVLYSLALRIYILIRWHLMWTQKSNS
jgi:hypothetical protein